MYAADAVNPMPYILRAVPACCARQGASVLLVCLQAAADALLQP